MNICRSMMRALGRIAVSAILVSMASSCGGGSARESTSTIETASVRAAEGAEADETGAQAGGTSRSETAPPATP